MLGLDADSVVDLDTGRLGPGDSLVLYTDGITEAHLAGEVDQLDESGVAAVLAGQASGVSADDLAGAVADAAFVHGGRVATDDASVVVVRIDPA